MHQCVITALGALRSIFKDNIWRLLEVGVCWFMVWTEDTAGHVSE
jgi:hypothetical protein